MKHLILKRKTPQVFRLLIAFLAAISIIFILTFENRLAPTNTPEAVETSQNVLFQCPDGRLGLHLVHTRFLIGQARASPVFTASRLAFLRSFLIPNLNAQTSQNFILYVAYDPAISPAILEALRATVEHANQKTILSPEANTTNPSFNMPIIMKHISQWDTRVLDVSITITSRIDLDDLAHTKVVAVVQSTACSAPFPGIKRGLSVKLLYIDRGMLWYPSTEHPYGQTCEWKNAFKSHLAIMQSMILVASPGKKGRKLLQTCSINVYSYPHYKPQEIEQLKTQGCGKVEFNATRDVIRWRPPGGKIGCLYSKTASSWSYGKLQHKGIVCQGADPERLERLFAGSRQRLAAVNALFIGLEKEAVELVANSTKQHLE